MGASGTQHRPSLASGSLSEYVRRPGHSQTQSSSRPACWGKKSGTELDKQAMAVCGKRGLPYTASCVLWVCLPRAERWRCFWGHREGSRKTFSFPWNLGDRGPHGDCWLAWLPGLPLGSGCHPCSLEPACALAAHSHRSTCCWCSGAERQGEGRWLWLLFEHLIIPD